jgi:hypothetical protein
LTVEERQAGWAEVDPDERKALIGGWLFNAAEFEAEADAQGCPKVRQVLEAKRRSKGGTVAMIGLSSFLYGAAGGLVGAWSREPWNVVIAGAVIGGLAAWIPLMAEGESYLDWDGAVAAYNDCKASSIKTKGNHD